MDNSPRHSTKQKSNNGTIRTQSKNHLFYKQTDGMVIGSPLSPILSNISADHKPSLWLRYVNERFSVWPHRDDELKSFLQHLNRQRPSIKLTVEKKNNGKLVFIDFLKDNNKKVTTTIYRKSEYRTISLL